MDFLLNLTGEQWVISILVGIVATLAANLVSTHKELGAALDECNDLIDKVDELNQEILCRDMALERAKNENNGFHCDCTFCDSHDCGDDCRRTCKKIKGNDGGAEQMADFGTEFASKNRSAEQNEGGSK